ncbi:hypothetical protein NM688_g1044 [Phlebia brevispora]|uniref:Uncharacterized protein n=1 Tax=Phlebia brevispora TaxID=194682 RepID=A0ACC1TC99_9APHY|nr:hypothetical protein NM688_g1044 [Phlebia brevispora]
MMSAHAGRDNNDIDSGHVLYDEALENITLKFLEFELLRDIEEQQASGLEQARLAGMQESRFQADIPPGTGQFPGDIPALYPGNSSSSSQSASMVPHASSAHIYDCSHLFDLPIKQANPLTIFCLFMVVVINIIGGASRPLCNFILQCCIRILTLSFRGAHRGEYPLSPLSQFEERLLKEFPRDLRHVRRIFRLEPMVTTYAACPKCSFVYPPSTNDVPNSSQYPTTCSWHYLCRNKEKTCGQTLVEFGAGRPFSIDKPIRPFTFRHMTDFVSHMLSRPDIEGHLERAWDRVQSSDTLTDMWHSPIILEVMQSHRRQVTTHSDDNPLFLIWGLCVDWFNPYGNKIAGTKRSVGMMALICYNLPPEIRCRPENMHLCGVIPGPREPSKEELNHFLAPLVDDLLEMWDPGVYFSRTAAFKRGRRVFSILGPLISDTPASKKASGQSSHGAHIFCSLCKLLRGNLGNLDETTWERISSDQHRLAATQWRNATSKAEQDRLLRQNGVRWSELLRLPYWDPTRFVVIDPMHNLLLGLIQFHCRVVLGLDVRQSSQDDSFFFMSRWSGAIDEQKLAEGRLLLAQKSPPWAKLRSLKVPNLLHLCREKQVWAEAKGKNEKLRINDLIQALLQPKFLRNYPTKPTENSVLLSADSELPAEVDPSNLLTTDLLEKIRHDVESHLRPSWMKSLPQMFGSGSHGKLKADQWRTALEFDLPMSLIEAWALQEGTVHQALVDNTMQLVFALRWALAPQITALHVSKYMDHMKCYLTGLQRLFPWMKLRPNHHYALHLGELLMRFGPMRGWWTFPFERLVGILQRVQTNMKPGQLESTMMNTFCMAGNLRGFLSTSSCPLTLSDGLKLMDDYLVQFRGVDHELHLASTSASLSPQAQRNKSQIKRLEQDAYEILMSQLPPGSLVSPQAISMRRVAVNGLQYTTAQESKRDSQVFFCSLNGEFVPGFIREIFLHTHHIPGQEPALSTGPSRSRQISETFAVIHRYPVVPAALDNPYARYPDFYAFMCQAPNRSSVDVVPVQRIMCHAGLHRTREGRYVLKALNRFMSSEASA